MFSFGQPGEKREPTLESSLFSKARVAKEIYSLTVFTSEQKASIDGSATIDGDRVR